jgi:aerobic-type carbon monoxide dehydrogenase small subunit (CoxS/CutS family)
MKNWLPDIIYKLFRFLVRYFFHCKAKSGNETGKRSTAPVKAAFMHVKSCLMIVFSAPGEKTLWLHTVFRGGISA